MKHFVLAAATAALAFAAPAFAYNAVVNGSFETTTLTDKGPFAGKVAGWSGGTGLDFLNYPGTAGTIYLEVYPGFPAVSPDGGNFFEADGDRGYGTPIHQSISGLTVGKAYHVTFYQAAGQQNGFTGPTTELWEVSLGTQTLSSPKFSLAQGATGPWEKVNLTFTATAATEVLKFFALGTPSGKPPISFLDGVVMNVPEPATWAMMLVGFGAIGAAMRRRSPVKIAA